MTSTANEVSTIGGLLSLPRFFWNLSSSGTKSIDLGGVTAIVGKQDSSEDLLVRFHRKVESREEVGWFWFEPKQLESKTAIATLLSRLEWKQIMYTASFRRSGDLNASEWRAPTYDEAYAYISDLDEKKEWRDDSFVQCNDGRPYWWG